jgi:flagellar biosynthesis/type III secretory pathway protein FliH
MSPKILKQSKVTGGSVRYESKTGPRDERKTEEQRAERALIAAEIRAELAAENAAVLAGEREKMAAQFQAELDKFYARSEPEIAQLILSIAARVCRQELTINREGVINWVREGLSVLGEDGPLTVRVHHDDAAAVRGLTETAGTGLKVQSDAGLAPGDVMIDGEKEQFDARVSTRLEEVDRAFRRMAEEGT